QTRWTPRALDVRGTAPRVEIRALARSLHLGDAAHSTLVMAGDWNVHASQTFDGSVSFHRLSGDVSVGEPPLAMGLSALVVKADIVRGEARASVDISGERVGRVQGEGSTRISRGPKGWQVAPNAPVAGHVALDVPDIAVFAAWLGPDAKANGHVQGNVAISGTGAA